MEDARRKLGKEFQSLLTVHVGLTGQSVLSWLHHVLAARAERSMGFSIAMQTHSVLRSLQCRGNGSAALALGVPFRHERAGKCCSCEHSRSASVKAWLMSRRASP